MSMLRAPRALGRVAPRVSASATTSATASLPRPQHLAVASGTFRSLSGLANANAATRRAVYVPGVAGTYTARPRHLSTAAASISFGGADEGALLTSTIPGHFAKCVQDFADRVAVISRAPVASSVINATESRRHASLLPITTHTPPRETVYTFADIDRISNLMGNSMQARLGIRKGDRVAVSLGNGPEIVALTYALAKLGAILVPLNPAFTSKQVVAALKHLEVKVLIIGAATDLPYKPGNGRSNLPIIKDVMGGAENLCQPADQRLQSPVVPSLEKILIVDNTPDHPAVAGSHDFFDQPTETPKTALTKFEFIADDKDILQGSVLNELRENPPPAVQPDEPLSPSDTVSIQFTSGTTSQPKAAMLSHTAILNNGYFIGKRMGLTPDDKIVCPPPMFHCFGSVLGYMATVTSGASLLLPSPAFDPAASLQMAGEHKATGLYGVSTMFVAMLEWLDRLNAQHEKHIEYSPRVGTIEIHKMMKELPLHLRKGIAAGSAIPETLMRRVLSTLGLNDLVICYGMTETAPVSCMTTPQDPILKRTSTVGTVMPHVGVKIVDPNDWSRVMPRNKPGELAVSGYSVMEGYWDDALRTREVLVRDEADGRVWMHSGDEAVMDEQGYVSVTGRIKDLIIRGGENIHPLEIENCLFEHPLIAEASVVGVPDAKYGEAVAAFIVPAAKVAVDGGVMLAKEGELMTPRTKQPYAYEISQLVRPPVVSLDKVQSWVRERLSSHLVPKYVFWMTSYPKTASGKIQKYVLRETATPIVHELAAAEAAGQAGQTGQAKSKGKTAAEGKGRAAAA